LKPSRTAELAKESRLYHVLCLAVLMWLVHAEASDTAFWALVAIATGIASGPLVMGARHWGSKERSSSSPPALTVQPPEDP